MSTTSDLNPERRERLEQELARMRERRRIMAAELEQRDTVGDRADNAEALELADDVLWVDERISELVARLTGGETDDQPGSLPDGAEVTLRFTDGTVETLRVVRYPDGVPESAQDVVTTHSPLGRALVGHNPGETITYPTPNGPVSAELIELRLPDDA